MNILNKKQLLTWCDRKQSKGIAVLFLIIGYCLVATVSTVKAAGYDPGPGKTLVLIGQTFKDEFTGYVNGIKVPAGSSHYGTFFWGTIEQGDDGPNNQFLSYVHNTYNGAFALVAFSIKDNWMASGCGSVEAACQAIANGQFDSQIDKYCAIMKSHANMKFLIRIGYEVSLYQFGNAQHFINAYNHTAKRIRNTNGVTNVEFVYHPVRGYNDATGMYPGDEYVDWIAVSIFNNDVCLACDDVINCPNDRLDPNLKLVFEWGKEKGKPLMIAESAVQSPAGNTAEGFSDYLDRVTEAIEAYDIRCWTYINSNWPAHHWPANIWSDSRVEARGDVVKKKWNDIVNQPRYVHYMNPNPIGNPFISPEALSTVLNAHDARLDLYAMNGKLVSSLDARELRNISRADLLRKNGTMYKNLSHGTYLIRIQSQGAVHFKKFLHIP